MTRSLYDLIDKIVEAYESTGLVRSVYFLPLSMFDTDRATQFPSLCISPQPSQLGDKVTSFNLTLHLVDRIDWSKDQARGVFGQDNLIDVMSKASRIHEIALSKLRRGEPYSELIRIIGDSFVSAPIVYEDNNYLGGWQVGISFEIPGGGVIDGIC